MAKIQINNVLAKL